MLAKKVKIEFNKYWQNQMFLGFFTIMCSLSSFIFLVSVLETPSRTILAVVSFVLGFLFAHSIMTILVLFLGVGYSLKAYLKNPSTYVEWLFYKLLFVPIFHAFYFHLSQENTINNHTELLWFLLLCVMMTSLICVALHAGFYIVCLVIIAVSSYKDKHEEKSDVETTYLFPYVNEYDEFTDEIQTCNTYIDAIYNDCSFFSTEEMHVLERNIKMINESLELYVNTPSKEMVDDLIRNGFAKLTLFLEEMTEIQNQHFKHEIEKRINAIK